jgi:hypothetical protein
MMRAALGESPSNVRQRRRGAATLEAMMATIPAWLEKSRSEDAAEDIYAAPDGTFSVYIDIGEVEPIHGVPTREMAEAIVKAMWAMEKSGASNALVDY